MLSSTSEVQSLESTAEYTCCCPATITTSVKINAPPEKVYEVLIDGPGHDQWNPFMSQCTFTKSTQVGETTQAVMNGDQKFTPVVTVHNPGQEFEWLGSMCCNCFFAGRHNYRLERSPTDPNATIFHQSEHFTGCFLYSIICLAPCILLKPTTKNFAAMNLALKKKAEESCMK